AGWLPGRSVAVLSRPDRGGPRLSGRSGQLLPAKPAAIGYRDLLPIPQPGVRWGGPAPIGGNAAGVDRTAALPDPPPGCAGSRQIVRARRFCRRGRRTGADRRRGSDAAAGDRGATRRAIAATAGTPAAGHGPQSRRLRVHRAAAGGALTAR